MQAEGPCPRQRGFTLAELLVTLGIVAISAGVCIPFARDLGHSMKLSALSNGLLADFYLARSEAIKRSYPVVICKSADGNTCAAAGGWDQGWIVFSDEDGNAVRGAGEPVLQRFQALPPGFRVTGNQTVGNYISYHPTGSTRMPSGAFQAGTITLCRTSEHASEARLIIVNAAGRPRIQKVAAHSCGPGG
jgi:type IV fimbrial biogenesis protein FimT